MIPRPILPLLVTLSLAACAAPGGAPGAGGAEALCDGLEPLARRHAAALVADGGDRSVVSGAELLAGLDAGCGAG